MEPDGLVVVTSEGVEKLKFTVLPEEICKKYNYDPKKAEQFTQSVATAESQRRQKLQETLNAEASEKLINQTLDNSITRKSGTISSITKQGALVADEGNVFFVYGLGGDKADGDYWTGSVYSVGNYKYTTVLGAGATVHAFALNRELAVKILAAR